MSTPVHMWKLTANERPPNGTLCDVITESGDERQLKYSSNLWWLPDMSMYVYFTPVQWRAVVTS